MYRDLKLSDRAKIIGLAVKSGITDLRTIESVYNTFAEGGPKKKWKALDNIQYEEVPDSSFTQERTGAGDIEVMFKDTPTEGYEYANGFKYAHPSPGNNVVIFNPKTNDEQDIRLDALHIMRKDDPVYGALLDELSYYADDGDIAINAKRRMEEDIKKYGRLSPGDGYQQYFDNEVDGFLRNMLIEGTPEYIESKRYYPDKEQLAEWNAPLIPYVEAIKNYLESGERPENVLEPSVITANKFKEGGTIHIKKENRGKFTALKKRTGHSASWFKAHGTPAQKKMAVFALNARKWKHGDGGLMTKL